MLVLDTHVLVWYLLGSKRLPENLRKGVDDARMRGDRLIVPTVVLAEALYISERHPETFSFADLHQIVHMTRPLDAAGAHRQIPGRTN